MPLRLGTRASALARWQAEWVAAQLRAARNRGRVDADHHDGRSSTRGRSRPSAARASSPRKSSWRCSTAASIWPCIASRICRPSRRRSCAWRRCPSGRRRATSWFRRQSASLAALPQRAAIGTGSLRRRTQLLHFRRDLQMKDIRGNVDTRLRKLARRRLRRAGAGRGGASPTWGWNRTSPRCCRWRSFCRRRAKGRWRWRRAPTTSRLAASWPNSIIRRPMRP